MRVSYHPEAEAELIEAARYYESKISGLGLRFLAEFDMAISAIEEAPTRWPIIESDLRRYLMRRFPYGIYYRAEGEEWRILAVKHHSRHPDYWRHRLEP